MNKLGEILIIEDSKGDKRTFEEALKSQNFKREIRFF
jgi:hypothetical protein